MLPDVVWDALSLRMLKPIFTYSLGICSVIDNSQVNTIHIYILILYIIYYTKSSKIKGLRGYKGGISHQTNQLGTNYQIVGIKEHLTA